MLKVFYEGSTFISEDTLDSESSVKLIPTQRYGLGGIKITIQDDQLVVWLLFFMYT